ncbi:MAG: 5-formyltetrahydrofolate cyclo-ligase [Pseudomonadota bacterium]
MFALDKSALRKSALKARDATDPDWRIEQSLALSKYAGTLALSDGEIVSGFLPIRSEIDLRPLMNALHAYRVTLCLPVVLDPQTITFRRYVPEMPLVDTGFGTQGPGSDVATVDPNIMLMPLAAFDARGNRLGYGAGHYDRAIARFHALGRKPRLVGCAFACQRVEIIPAEPHDVPLDAILTEEGLHHFPDRA